MLEFLDAGRAERNHITFDGVAEELEPPCMSEVFNLLGIEFHLSLGNLFFHDSHSLFVIRSDKQCVIGVADIFAIQCVKTFIQRIHYYISKPRSHRAALFERLISALQLSIGVEVPIGMIILSEDIDDCGVAPLGFHSIESFINEADGHGIEVFAEVRLPANLFTLGLAYLPRDFLDNLTTTDTLLIRPATWMNHLRHQLKQ